MRCISDKELVFDIKGDQLAVKKCVNVASKGNIQIEEVDGNVRDK